MKINKILPLLNTGRYQAIVKEIAGRRMFIGIERISKRSRRYQQKFMCTPVDLEQLVKKHADSLKPAALLAQSETDSPLPTPPSPPENPAP